MLLERRPPWWRHPDRPSPLRDPVAIVSWESADHAALAGDGFVQVVGYMDEMIESNHFVVRKPWWDVVASAPWLEVVDLDDDLIWRMSGRRALRENARVIRGGELRWMLYLPCFDVTRLDRRHVRAAQQAQ